MTGAAVICPNCGVSHQLRLRRRTRADHQTIELGLNAAQSRDNLLHGDQTAPWTTTPPASAPAWALRRGRSGLVHTSKRSLILGVGLNRTEVAIKSTTSSSTIKRPRTSCSRLASTPHRSS